MNQKLITDNPAFDLLLQEVPKGENVRCRVKDDILIVEDDLTGEKNCGWTEHLPLGNWQFLFAFSKEKMPTEEQAGECVEKCPALGLNQGEESEEYFRYDKEMFAKNSQEAFSSLLLANEIYLDNPKGEKKPRYVDFLEEFWYDRTPCIIETPKEYFAHVEKWQQAEDGLWGKDGKLIVVLKKNK